MGINNARAYANDEVADAHLWSLVAAIQADPDAAAGPFGELYRLTRGIVFRYIRSRIGSHHDAEDVASEVYLRARRRIAALQPNTASPAAWLVTIARNLVADYYKKAEKRLTIPVAEPIGRTPEGRPECADLRDRTAEAADEMLWTIALYGAVSRLTGLQREAVRLRYLLGETVAGTAEQMGRDEGAVKALTYRATRRMLRDPAVAGIASARSRLAA